MFQLLAQAAQQQKPWYEDTALGYLIDGGIFMWPILFLGILAAGVMIERYRSLKMLATNTQSLRTQVLDLLRQDRVEEALELCNRSVGPVPAILAVGLRKFLLLKRLKYDAGKIEGDVVKSMDDYAVHIVGALEKHLAILATVSSVAPMFGFLGTVQGMVISFKEIVDKQRAGTGTNIVVDAAEGIQIALLTTVFGLVVGIPAFMAFNYFTSIINRFVLEVEESATDLIEAVTLQMALTEKEASSNGQVDGTASEKEHPSPPATRSYQGGKGESMQPPGAGPPEPREVSAAIKKPSGDASPKVQAGEPAPALTLDKHYTNDRFNISLWHPANWEIKFENERDDTWEKVVGIFGPAAGGSAPGMTVLLGREPYAGDMPSFLRELESNLGGLAPGFNVVSTDSRKVLGWPAAWMVYGYDGEHGPMREQSITLFLGHNRPVLLQFVGEASRDEFAKLGPTFLAMIGRSKIGPGGLRLPLTTLVGVKRCARCRKDFAAGEERHAVLDMSQGEVIPVCGKCERAGVKVEA